MKFANWLEKHKKTILCCAITALLTYILSCICFIGTDGMEQLYLKHIIKKYYVEDVDDATLNDGAMMGMINSLGDEHSVFISSNYGFDNFDMELSGEYSGIGVTLTSEDDKVIIYDVFPNSPADVAGLKVDDILIKVNDTDVSKMSGSEISKLIKFGEEDKFDITVIRDGKEVVVYNITKGEIDVPTVKYNILDNNIGYMWISSFDATTDFEVKTAIENMAGIESLIIDVRDNPGGFLNVVVDTLDLFLDEGLVLKVAYKGDRVEEIHSNDGMFFEKPVVVLTNGNSASASEIFAAAMGERERATVVGTNTYGKGTVQSVFELPDNSGANITVAKFYSPLGKPINKKGVEPEHIVENPDIYDEIYVDDIPSGEDVQLNFAVELLDK